jgi:hypothetical protein
LHGEAVTVFITTPSRDGPIQESIALGWISIVADKVESSMDIGVETF